MYYICWPDWEILYIIFSTPSFFFLRSFLFSSPVNTINDDIDSINNDQTVSTKSATNCSKNSSCCYNYYWCNQCCCRCYKHHSGALLCQVASTEHFVKLYGTCLCITYILLDIFHCWAIIVHAEGYGAEDNDLWNGGGVLTCTIKLFL